MFETNVIDGGIAPLLADHQQAAAWSWKDLAQKLYDYDRKLRDWFSLDLPPFVIRFGRLHRARLGHFMPGCNEFAISGEIAINIRYAHSLPFWGMIGTLHHEQLHLWQHVHGRAGKNNYHNRQYQRKAAESGLVVDAGGHTQYDPNGRFIAFLKEHGVDVPTLPPPFESIRRRSLQTASLSKLKRWSCGCTNIWAAVQDVTALCLRCNQAFMQGQRAEGDR
jgi:hypothetical protein